MHEVSVGDIYTIVQPKVLFCHTNELESPDIANAETDLTKNFQDNGATPPFGTQPYSSHSPLEDTLVAPSEPPPHPRVESADADTQAGMGDLLDFRLLGSNYILFLVYQYFVHQNPGYYLGGGITEDGKWQARWENRMYANPTIQRTVRKSWEDIC